LEIEILGLNEDYSSFIVYHIYNLNGRLDVLGNEDLVGSIFAPTANLNVAPGLSKPKLNGQVVAAAFSSGRR
jgi:hypothetical protein